MKSHNAVALQAAVKRLRAELKMNQTVLAQALGLTTATVNRWETGHNSPNRSTAIRLLGFAKERGASGACQAALREALLPASNMTGIDDLKYADLDRINQLMDDSSNGVTICDRENYRLLYVNRRGQELCGQPLSHAESGTCYEYFRHRASPCPDCPMNTRQGDVYIQSEYASPQTGRHFLQRSKNIEWNGRPASITYITDVTDFVRLQKKMAESQKVFEAARRFAHLWVCTFDLENNCVQLDPHMANACRLPKVLENFPEDFLKEGWVLPEDHSAALAMVEAIRAGQSQADAVVRGRYQDDQIHWLRLRMNLIERGAGGQPRLAVCSCQPIDEEKALEMRMRFEHEEMLSANPTMTGFIICDLTENRVLEHHGYIATALTMEDSSYDRRVQDTARWVEPEESKAAFAQVQSRQGLLESYNQGRLERNSEFQFRQENGTLRWIRHDLHLMLDPATGHVYLYEYGFDVHESKMLDGLMAAASMHRMDYLGLIQMENGQFSHARYNVQEKRTELETTAYAEAIGAYCAKAVCPEDRADFARATALEQVKRQLNDQPVYEYAYRAQNREGELRFMQLRYSWYDEEKTACLLSGFEVTRTLREP